MRDNLYFKVSGSLTMGKLPKMNEMSFLGGYLLNNLRVALSVNVLILRKHFIWPITFIFHF